MATPSFHGRFVFKSPSSIFRSMFTCAAIGFLLHAAACGSAPATGPYALNRFENRIVQLVVNPDEVTLSVNDSTEFKALALTAAGDTTQVAVSWTASEGNITGQGKGKALGRYKCNGKPGKRDIIAQADSGSFADTAQVTCIQPGEVTVIVVPDLDTLVIGETLQFVVEVRDPDGQPVNDSQVSWSSSDTDRVTISQSGQAQGRSTGSATITATSSGASGTAELTVTDTQPDKVTVTVVPDQATIEVGESLQLVVEVRDVNGQVIPEPQVTWSSNTAGVATVSSTGLVQGRAAGAATISATSFEQTGTAEVTVTDPPPPPAEVSGFFVATSGSGSGNGSLQEPWDLSTALAHPATVQPGDTIWLRGGTYRGNFTSNLTGSPSAAIIVRQYPGERAIIDGSLLVQGSDAWYWGFEVANTDPTMASGMGAGVNVFAPRSKFINMVIHDHREQGVGFWSEAPDSEIYGCIVYSNGWGSSRGPTKAEHGIYTQNASGTKRLADNIVFNQFGYGFHAYGSSMASLRGFVIEGNTSFNNGMIAGQDYLVGGGTPVERLTFVNNASYRAPDLPGGVTAQLGYHWGPLNTDGIVTDNGFFGEVLVSYWSGITFTRNTMGRADGPHTRLTLEDGQSTAAYRWDANTYARSATASGNPFEVLTYPAGDHGGTASSTSTYTFPEWQAYKGFDASSTHHESPSGTLVFVRPNEYEPGRGHVTVYNWDGQSSVSVDVSAMLSPGDRYEVREAQNYFGPSALEGTYDGNALALPMTPVTGPTAVAGQQGGPPPEPPSTGTQFHVFVIVRSSSP
jgi:hypothetical protein